MQNKGTVIFSQDDFAQYAGPGNWNDPDMLIIGNFALSRDQSRVQMAVWSVLAAPLIMSNDLRDIGSEFVDILTNKNVIKINQDPIGHQGRRVFQDKVRNKLNKRQIRKKPFFPDLSTPWWHDIKRR